MIPIHPDDILLFTEVSAAMRRVATNYKLPLGKIDGFPMPLKGMVDRMGDCTGSGNIRLVLRCTEDGKWCDAPLSPDEIWDTAAHELAHLRFMNHSDEFNEFWEELHVAMRNQRRSHKDKILDKLVKLQNMRQGATELGNSEEAEAFARKINEMLIAYELSPTDVDYARASDNDPVIEIIAKLSAYGIEPSKVRSAWQENFAGVIANAHLCKILVRPGSNMIVFVGTKSHATVAEYLFGTMVVPIEKMAKKAEVAYWYKTGCGRGDDNKAKGYKAAWIDAFITRIWQRFADARVAAVLDAAEKFGTSSETAMVRLDGALVKVQGYINDKFGHHRAARSANAFHRRSVNHADGRAAGRAAADNIPLGRKGLTSNDKKQLS